MGPTGNDSKAAGAPSVLNVGLGDLEIATNTIKLLRKQLAEAQETIRKEIGITKEQEEFELTHPKPNFLRRLGNQYLLPGYIVTYDQWFEYVDYHNRFFDWLRAPNDVVQPGRPKGGSAGT